MRRSQAEDDLVYRNFDAPNKETIVPESVLMITAIAGAENCAAALSKQFGFTVEIAANRKAGLVALRNCEYALIVVDSSLIESDPDGADMLLRYSGLAIPLEINFAISGSGRLIREVRAALKRREQEQALAARAAATTMERNLRDTVAGLLLQSELALAEPEISPQLAAKLKLVVELAGNLRQRLDRPGVS